MNFTDYQEAFQAAAPGPERITILADVLETGTLPERTGFNIELISADNREGWVGEEVVECGSVCCVGGLVHLLAGTQPGRIFDLPLAENLLGVNPKSGLFVPPGWICGLKDYPPSRVVKALRNLAATGELVW